MRTRLFFLCPALLLLAACGKEDPIETPCPAGTVREGSVCVRPDDDAGTDPDSGLPIAKDGGPEDGGPIDAGEDAATISTAQLDFEGALLNTVESLSFTIENRTAQPVVINVGAIAGALEFRLDNPPAGSVTMQPSDSITVKVDYSPTAAGVHSGTLPVSLCEGGCIINVMLSGTGLVEAISCGVSSVDFGFVNPNSCASQDVVCENLTSRDATILTASLTSNSAPAFGLTASSTTPVTLPGGDALTLTVQYCPTDFTNDSGTLALTIDHPDPRYTSKAIALSGTGGGPDIQCTPSVAFGVSGVGQTLQRNATCTNAGNVPLSISAAAFAPLTTPELTASLSAAPPLTLQPGDSLGIQLTFVAAGPGMHAVSFLVASNDTDTPEATIAVTAEALQANGCGVLIAPAALAFGAVAPGASSEAVSVVRNVGTGACAINVVGLSASTAPEFTLVDGTQSVNLAPNDTFGVRVRFAPGAETTFAGEVQLTTTDATNAMPTIALSGDGLSPFGSIRALPAAIDFGQVQAGCTNAASQQLSLQNNAATPTDVTVTLEAGTPGEFALISTAPNPVSIPAGATADFTITFLPGAAGNFSGRVQIAIAGGATLFVPLDGEGSAVAQTTVTFPAQPTPQLDVLVVVDDSCSMSEEQAALAAAGSILTARGDAAGAEYHIGVTTTDGTAGVSGTLRGSPTVVDWTSPTRNQDLAANINQGINGSGIEEGLRTATEAVTDSALLSGPNAGFLRPNAALVIIMISDEEDQSPDLVPSYLAALTTDRPTGASGTPRIFTITGGLTGCVTAAAAPRLVEAATLSGGFDRSACLTNYTGIMTEIGDATFAPARARFPLGASPVPGSVVVRVNGTTAPVSEWGIDFVTNEVVFLPGNEPLLSETVAIDYETVCVGASCGNGTPNPGEQCDDGNPVNTDACLEICLNAFCGDTFMRAAGEQCDDGNTIAGDGCNAQCTIEGCGNGIPEPPEECDNGANNSDTVPNACRTGCVNPSCGDTVPDTGEQCDDGNTNNNDACAVCQNARCGDGFPRQGVEECDDGNTNNNDACANDCTSNLINFVVTNVQQALTPAAGTALAIDDEQIVSVAIGFPFDFLGVAVTDVQVGDNGFILFETPAGSSGFFPNDPIPDVAAPNAMIAWWWDDHDPGRALTPAPEIRSAVTGTAPNRVRTITFLNLPRFAALNAETGHLTAEVRLFETTNVIEVHYGAIVDTANNTEWSASIGWESQGGTRGAAVLGCTPTCLQADWPTNTVHRYTPQ